MLLQKQATISYSNLQKSGKEINKPGLIIKSKSQNDPINNADILKDIKRHIFPSEKNLKGAYGKR